jgi:hypothetical protein
MLAGLLEAHIALANQMNTPQSADHVLLTELFARLPPEWPDDPTPVIQATLRGSGVKVVVLDDDPTGTQTVHGVPVLTEWPAEVLSATVPSGPDLLDRLEAGTVAIQQMVVAKIRLFDGPAQGRLAHSSVLDGTEFLYRTL